MGYLNTEGHNWGPENLDGYGISLIVFSVIYSIFFYVACYQVWTLRKHPIIKMRNSGLAIVSLHILHVYMFMVWLVYPLNGAFPCSIEFWVMSLYLPIGFGLFQAANQQLCVVSQDQYRLGQSPNASYKPIVTGRGLKVLCLRIKLWWDYTSSQGKYEGFVAVGIVVQVSFSLSITRFATDSSYLVPCLLGYLLHLAQMELLRYREPSHHSWIVSSWMGMVSLISCFVLPVICFSRL